MNEAQKVAYIMSQIVCAQAEIAGMQAENTHTIIENQSIKYGLGDFQAVITRFGIGHNDVISYFTGR